MKELKQIIHKVISEKSEIDWFIIHSIAKSAQKITGIQFSSVDDKERYDEPFKTSQGWLSLKEKETTTEFQKIIGELSAIFKRNPIALTNLYIITTRTSYNREDEELLLEAFKNEVDTETCQTVFNLLINSLNTEYHKSNYNAEKQPANTDEWLTLFRSTQYMRSFSDPIISCLQLVRSERSRKLNFDLIQNMKPLLRAVLMGWYGYDLSITAKTQTKIYENEQELIFLSACLIDDFSAGKTSPDWLTQKLVELFVEKHWAKIGKPVFIHAFGLSYRNKQENDVYKKLEDLLHEILFKKLSTENPETINWIGSLEFPSDFIALFAWISSKQIDYHTIPSSNKSEILNQFIRELQRIETELPKYLASENSSDPFTSFQFSEAKYQDTFAHLLLLMLNATSSNFKDLKKLCFGFKPFFYGGFRATSLAKHFTELMLLIGLSGFRLKGLGEKEFKAIKEFMKIISDMVLVPYIHLSEREDEVWNPENKKELLQYNAGQYLMKYAFTKIKEQELKLHYEDFFHEIDQITVTNWEK